MLKVKEQAVYKAFGLTFKSEIHLPELSRSDIEFNPMDIEVKIENITEQWSELVKKNNGLFIDESLVGFEVPSIAIFFIEGGKKITIFPLVNYDEDVARLYILGSCMGIILMQRRILPLHGSAIKINGKAYAFIGESGAGKSTLSTAFLSKGYQLLSDDVIAVTLTDDNVPFVTPSYPQQKLWQESLQEFGMNKGSYRPIFKRETKFAIPVLTQFSPEPLPLGGIFELVKTDKKEVDLLQIDGLARLQTLFSHTYRNFLIQQLGLIDWHFTTSAKILSDIKIHQLQRPTRGFSVHQLVSLILNTIDQEERKC